jgi:hyperosmotically inducible protein
VLAPGRMPGPRYKVIRTPPSTGCADSSCNFGAQPTSNSVRTEYENYKIHRNRNSRRGWTDGRNPAGGDESAANPGRSGPARDPDGSVYRRFDNLNYQVNNGVVTLSGEVTQPVRKTDVERAVESIPGVTAVNDQIEVLPLSPMDDQIRVRTLRTMLRSAPLDKYFQGVQPSIRIIVKNGDVTLDGVVLNNGDRQIAYITANQVPGVFSVTNNLRTEPRIVR